MKGQVALEYLVIAGFLLLATGIIFIYSIVTLNDNIKFAKADKALAQLAAAADKVSARGPNNAIFVEIDLPNEIVSNQVIIADNTLSLALSTPVGTNQRYSESNAELQPGILSMGSGRHTVKVEMVNDAVVFTEV